MTTLTAPVADKWRLGEHVAEYMRLIGFEPTGEEQARILRCRKRFKVVSGGGQAGKSLTASVDWVIHMFEDMAAHPGEPLLYWLVAADYERTRAEFEYIKGFLLTLGIDRKYVDFSKRVDPGFIEVKFPGQAKYSVRVETKSGKDPRTLSMYGPHGIIGCEASQLDLETHFKVLERLASKNGWLHYSGTFESSLGWYPGLVKAWAHGDGERQSFVLSATTNYHKYPQGLLTPSLVELRKQHGMSDDYFNEKIMGIAAPPKGLVFNEFRPDVHIRPVEYDPGLPVYISNDPGYGHANAVEVWQVAQGGQIRVFDEIYERGIIMADVIDICMKREWWKNESKTLTVDPNYATQHHGGRSMAEIWQEKAHLTPFGTKIRINEGTERLKSFLKVDMSSGEPGIVFHPKCKGILSELGAYPNPFNDQTMVYSWKIDNEGNVVGDTPEDKNNDGIKALIYGVVEKFGLVSTEDSGYFTVSDYFEERPGLSRRRKFLERGRKG